MPHTKKPRLPEGLIRLSRTYFYVSYFLAQLLIHRQLRDDENCKKKYGEDWKKYKKAGPYRICQPYVY